MRKIRLDRQLARTHPKLSRTELKKMIASGLVLVDGVPRKPSFLLRGGETIEIRFHHGPRKSIPEPGPEAIPLDILYEDDEIIVVNKPAGMVVHPAAGNYTGTLVNAVLYHLTSSPPPLLIKERGKGGEVRPGIVHRLDKGTSGVMVVAKTDAAHRELSRQFKKREVKKSYRTLVFGKFREKEGVIERPIGRDPAHRRKFSSRARHSRPAVTRYKVIRELENLSLLEVYPETGRTHQIRVHLSEAHHPIVGDTIYGAKSFLSSIKREGLRLRLESLTRPFLHALSLVFFHPATRKRVEFSAPLPPDLELLLLSRFFRLGEADADAPLGKEDPKKPTVL